jgi:hypothetical protein
LQIPLALSLDGVNLELSSVKRQFTSCLAAEKRERELSLPIPTLLPSLLLLVFSSKYNFYVKEAYFRVMYSGFLR